MMREPRPAYAVDVDATVDALVLSAGLAESGLPVSPVAMTGERRWVRAMLVRESGAQMPIWGPTLGELTRLLARRGAFRTVGHRELRLSGERAVLGDPTTARERDALKATWHRDEVIIVASDFVSSPWREGYFAACLDAWGKTQHVLLLHLLPRRLWNHTWTGSADLSVAGQVPGGPSASLLAGRPPTRARRTARPTATGTRAVAIASIDPTDLSDWARALVAQPGRCDALALDRRLGPMPNWPTAKEASDPAVARRSRAEAFKARASPEARRLARCLTFMAPLTLPMMQWAAAALVPDCDSGHLAEFFLGGLLDPAGYDSSGDAVFDLHEDVRANLAQGIPMAEAYAIIRTVGDRLMQAHGLEGDSLMGVNAQALDALPEQATDLRAFAMVTRSFLMRAGRLSPRDSTETVATPKVAITPSLHKVPPHEFLTQEEISEAVRRSGLVASDDVSVGFLSIFETSQQHTTLVFTRRSVVIVLDDTNTRRNDSVAQQVMKLEQTLPVQAREHADGSASIRFGDVKGRWYYSVQLFARPADIEDAITAAVRKARQLPMVVVSYVRTYAALARSLVLALEATGRLDVRYDGHLSSEQSFPGTVMDWIDQSDAMVVLVGPASAQAKYSKVELERAMELRKPVVAVVVEAGELPSAFSSHKAVNVDSDGKLLLLAKLKGRHLESALRRVALQVLEAVTEVWSRKQQRSAPAERTDVGIVSPPDAELSVSRGLQAGAERAIVHAVPGEDIVVIRLVRGPELTLHPENARDLLQSQQQPSHEVVAAKLGADDAPMDGSTAPTDAEVDAANNPADVRVPISALAGTPPLRWAGSLAGVLLSALNVVGPRAKDPSAQFVLSGPVLSIDGQVDAGVYELSPHELVPLKGTGSKRDLVRPAPTSDPTHPLLVLIHGSFVDTSVTFRGLWNAHPDMVRKIFEWYAGRVYALEHATMGASVISNALILARALPEGAHVHLATHGRGGLVAEVLARAASAEFGSPDLEHFSSPAHKGQGIDLRDLGQIVRSKRLRIDRVVRVACPARGSMLASKRLDAYLSVVKWSLELSGASVRPELIDCLREAARRRVDPSELPGLADMLPDSPLVQWLNAAEEPIPGTLRVLAGDLRGDSVVSWAKTLVADAFFWTDNDLVVQTRSMYGGVSRVGGSTFWFDSGPKVSHFAYFANSDSAQAFTEALLYEQPEGFREIGPLSHAGQDAGGVR